MRRNRAMRKKRDRSYEFHLFYYFIRNLLTYLNIFQHFTGPFARHLSHDVYLFIRCLNVARILYYSFDPDTSNRFPNASRILRNTNDFVRSRDYKLSLDSFEAVRNNSTFEQRR